MTTFKKLRTSILGIATCALFPPLNADSPDAVVVFNEVHYNPPGASEDGEWIELFNQMGIKTDISGWRLEGVDYTFPPGTVIDPGKYIIVAKTPTSRRLGPFTGNINNDGETLRLYNQGNRLMDELDFGDNGRWPASADGSGSTLAKRSPYTANSPAENWTVSSHVGGTPGTNNFPSGAPTLNSVTGAVFNEIPPATEAIYWVELVNTDSSPLEMGGMTISADGDPLREYTLPPGELAAGGLLLLDETALGFRLADGEKLFLYSSLGTITLDARQVTGRLRGRSTNHGNAWLYPNAPTPGTANTFTFREDVVISEIAYNPPALPAVPEVPATFDTTPLIEMDQVWRYNDTDESLPVGWATSTHPIGGNWKSGAAPIGLEADALPVPLVTTLSAYSSGTITYYYEAEFSVSPTTLATADSLQITHLTDDGAVFYLNGERVGDFNVSTDPATPETTATPGVTNAVLQILQIPMDELVSGTNRLSVEVHQSGIGSSDTVFGLSLDARVQTAPGTPALPLRGSDNQWIEIANRGSSTINLGGWDFDDGVNFTFPVNTMLAPGEHACIARDNTLFTAAFPSARLLGEFSGGLSRTGERLLLRDASRNPADEVHYFDSGRWPDAADRGGSTLELRDLDADNNTPEAWEASDESGQTSWQTYTFRGRVSASRGPDSKWSEFNMGLLAAGEILIDDITVTEDPDGSAVQKLSNTNFTSGASGWRLRGNHSHSGIIDDPDSPGNKVLRILASGGTGHMHNQIETTLLSTVTNGLTYEVSFRARWVSGSNQLHTRLYFNRFPRVTVIDRPADGGTPSATNSQAEANIGPTMSGFRHSPAVPDANDPVDVTVRASDPDVVTGLTLFYSVNGGSFQSIGMSAGADDLYTAQIPGQSAAFVVQFYTEATDGLGATATFPAAGPDSRALYKVNDGLAATNGQHNFRIVVTNAERDFIHEPIQVMSNDRIRATIIDREEDVYYNVKLRLKGSERARNQTNRVGFNMRFGADQLYRGIHRSMAIDRSEGVGQGQIEILWDIMIANSGGIVSRYYDLIKVIAPKDQHTRSAVLQMARYDDVFLDSQFEDGSDGNLFEYERLYTPNNADGNSFKIPEPDDTTGIFVGAETGDDKEKYRWFFLKKNNRDADDFGPIIAYNKKFAQSGTAFEAGLEDVVDVDAWFRGMAYAVLSGAGDNAGANGTHNGMYYARPDGRVMFLPHDMDFAFSTTRSIFANSQCSKLTADPVRKRIYLGHLHDIISTTYNNSYMSMWTDHLATFDPGQNWTGHLSYLSSRSSNVLSQINGQIAPVSFAITTTDPLSIGTSTAAVDGTGWVDVREIRLIGTTTPLTTTWTDGDIWQVTLPVAPGSHSYSLEAIDFAGAVIGSDTIIIDNTTLFEPASSTNLAVSEFMYHPAAPTVAEMNAGFTDADLFEFIELMNISTMPVDLSGAAFTKGINHSLPSIMLAPGERIVLARDRNAFLSRHPGAVTSLLVGEYYGFGDTNQLSNSGEQIILSDPFGIDIRRFTYSDSAPWPSTADGDGPSLVLVNPDSNPNHTQIDNWRLSTISGGNPGTFDAVTFAGDPDADLDHNGIPDLVDHALTGSGTPFLTLAGNILTFEFTRNLAADDVRIMVQISEDLQTWSDGSSIFNSPTSSYREPDGEHLSYNVSTLAFPGNQMFVRLQVTQSNP